jgi:hypothetical protein
MMTTLRSAIRDLYGNVLTSMNDFIFIQGIYVIFKRLITLFKLPQMDHTLIMKYIYNVQYIKNKILIIDLLFTMVVW